MAFCSLLLSAEHGPEVEAAVGRVLQRLAPGATFEDMCTGVEAATGLEYMPDGEVFQPFKKAIRRGLNALFADVTSKWPQLFITRPMTCVWR